jgi:hypothetical protein
MFKGPYADDFEKSPAPQAGPNDFSDCSGFAQEVAF